MFDGYRVAYELVYYVGNLHKIHIFPDWHTIYDSNKLDMSKIWGREPNQVYSNAKYWKAEYVIIYQDSLSKLDEVWSNNKFKCLGSFDWDIFSDELSQGEIIWSEENTPKWFLLKVY